MTAEISTMRLDMGDMQEALKAHDAWMEDVSQSLCRAGTPRPALLTGVRSGLPDLVCLQSSQRLLKQAWPSGKFPTLVRILSCRLRT